MQRHTVYFYLETALHVLGGTTTHHQERKQLYLQHLVFVRPLLLSAAIAADSSNGLTNNRCCRYSCLRSWWWIIRSANNCIYSIWYLSDRYCYLPLQRQVAVTVWQIPDDVDTVVCSPDDGWWYHPKYIEQFPDKNKMCNVASCWIYIRIFCLYLFLKNVLFSEV